MRKRIIKKKMRRIKGSKNMKQRDKYTMKKRRRRSR